MGQKVLRRLTRKDVKGMHKDMAVLVLLCSKLGWEARRQGLGWRMTAPDGSESLYFPGNHNTAQSKIRNFQQIIGTWATRHTTVANMPALAQASAALAKGDTEAAQRHWDTFAEQVRKDTEVNDAPTAAPTPEPSTPALGPAASTGRTVVSSGPVRVPYGDQGWYESQAVNKRTWSDGSVDYTCTHCGKVAATALGINAHWGRRDHDAAAKARPRVTIHYPGGLTAPAPDGVGYAARQERRRRLRGPITDPELLAKMQRSAANARAHKAAKAAQAARDAITDPELLAKMQRSAANAKAAQAARDAETTRTVEAAQEGQAEAIRRQDEEWATEVINSPLPVDTDPAVRAAVEQAERALVAAITGASKRGSEQALARMTAERDDALKRLADLEGEVSAMRDMFDQIIHPRR